MKDARFNRDGQGFCALLPQLLLAPAYVLAAYADHDALLAFTAGNGVCDDFALSATSGLGARAAFGSAHAATALARAPVGVDHSTGETRRDRATARPQRRPT